MKQRIFSIFLILAGLGCQTVDRQRFVPVERAGRAVSDAVKARPTLPQLRELVSAYSLEVAKTRQAVVRPEELAIVERYEEARQAMVDLIQVWEAKEASGGAARLPISEELPARIAKQYDLGVNTNEPPSIYSDEAMTMIWAVAQQRLEAAHTALVD